MVPEGGTRPVFYHNKPTNDLCYAIAFFACFFIWPFTAKYGRRRSLILASAIFNVGAVIQTINTHSLAAFYVARVISGIGVGMATVIVPMYSAEMAPKNIRGMLGSMFQFFFTMGVMTSYWIDYASDLHIADNNSAQWQVPVSMQLVPGAILGLGMLLTKESTRWLAKKGRREEALASLAWVRGGDSPEVQEESVLFMLSDQYRWRYHLPLRKTNLACRFLEIIASIEEENRIKSGITWKELLEPINRYRLFLIIALQIGRHSCLKEFSRTCKSNTL